MKNISVLYGIILILAISLLVSLLGLCNSERSPIIPSAGIINSIESNQAHGAVLFSDNGDISLVNSKGQPGTPCSFASLDGKAQQKSTGKPCKGFDGGKVLSLKAIPLLGTKGSFCMGIINGRGQLVQVCD